MDNTIIPYQEVSDISSEELDDSDNLLNLTSIFLLA